MTAPYSVDLRERARARKEAGETNREIAAALRISPSCVSKWTKRKRETGSLAPIGYSLEYGNDGMDMHQDAVALAERVMPWTI
jgi:hypothetical protein